MVQPQFLIKRSWYFVYGGPPNNVFKRFLIWNMFRICSIYVRTMFNWYLINVCNWSINDVSKISWQIFEPMFRKLFEEMLISLQNKNLTTNIACLYCVLSFYLNTIQTPYNHGSTCPLNINGAWMYPSRYYMVIFGFLHEFIGITAGIVWLCMVTPSLFGPKWSGMVTHKPTD